MLLSDMVLDGIVVDIGHEITSIVPFVDGRASYWKTSTFPVGGCFNDYVLSNFLFRDSISMDKRELFGDSLYFNYKMKMLRENQMIRNELELEKKFNYKLPDGTFLTT